MTTETLTTEAMILLGHGYELAIAPEAAAKRDKLLSLSRLTTEVANNHDSFHASFALRQLAAMRLAVEKCRKEVKEPVNRIAKLIDSTARDFLDPISDEECRIKALVAEHATNMAKERAAKEAAERKAFDKARAAREAANEVAGLRQGLAAQIEARRAEQEYQEALSERLAASNELHATKAPDGVRFAWDFEVWDIAALSQQAPNLVSIEPKRAEILKRVREIAERLDGDESLIGEFFEHYGIRTFKKPIVASR